MTTSGCFCKHVLLGSSSSSSRLIPPPGWWPAKRQSKYLFTRLLFFSSSLVGGGDGRSCHETGARLLSRPFHPLSPGQKIEIAWHFMLCPDDNSISSRNIISSATDKWNTSMQFKSSRWATKLLSSATLFKIQNSLLPLPSPFLFFLWKKNCMLVA